MELLSCASWGCTHSLFPNKNRKRAQTNASIPFRKLGFYYDFNFLNGCLIFIMLRPNIFHMNQYLITFRLDTWPARSSQSRKPPFTLFPPWLLRQRWRSQSINFSSNGRSGEFIQFIYCFLKAFMLSLHSSLGTFFGKKWLELAAQEAGKPEA